MGAPCNGIAAEIEDVSGCTLAIILINIVATITVTN